MVSTFYLKVTDDIESRLVEQKNAQELFDMIEANREYSREWLPWLDGIHSFEDESAFIESSLGLFAQNMGFLAGIWFKERLCGTIGRLAFTIAYLLRE